MKNQEIERKFLITGDYKKEVISSRKIIQGYISSSPERTVRVRMEEQRGFLTIKGKSTLGGLTRFEWEREISREDAENLLKLCEGSLVEKTRHIVNYESHRFEVDEFSGDNEGLVIAELELESEEESFIKPLWLGEEVSFDKRYFNLYLSQHPFKTW
ncbi:MAG: adenylate cyclase [Bacteroidetes bacterium HGW-Bacteroidetes-14]|jgi:CYTH domain-containing protein|nr:MAG: adenylate cyclase [Bacteroidetes bacterium HGW-Bacteroidetes-14]